MGKRLFLGFVVSLILISFSSFAFAKVDKEYYSLYYFRKAHLESAFLKGENGKDLKRGAFHSETGKGGDLS